MRTISLTCLVMLSVFFVGRAHAGEIVIANESVAVDAIDAETLKNVFLGKATKLDDGSKVVFAVQSSGATSEAFLKDQVGKSPSQFLSYWRKLAFSGKGSMPEEVGDDVGMVAYVKSTPGAIGYVSDGAALDGVKTLAVK